MLRIGVAASAVLICITTAQAVINAPAILDSAASKLSLHDAASSTKTNYPNETTGTTWSTVGASGWMSGFYPGALWLAYDHTSDPAMLARAQDWTAGLAGQQFNTGTHDVGFMIYNSYGNSYRLTGDPNYKSVILNAAYSLSSRFDPDTGCTQSWGSGGSSHQVIVDNMMNLELLMWASKNGGSSARPGWTLDAMAISHADKTIANHVRADGSTWHVVQYNSSTGAVQGKYTVQGYSNDSCWARGQAWGLYGFTMMYRETGLTRFRDAAMTLADYSLDHLPVDAVPPADFIFGQPGVPFDTNLPNKDATAGAIATAGLLELSQLVADPVASAKYFDNAENMLEALTSPTYLSLDGSFASLLKHGAHHASAPADAGYIWGDYYLMQSLLRYDAIVPEPAILVGLLAVFMLRRRHRKH